MGIRNSTYQGTCTAQSYHHLALQTGNGTDRAHLPSTADSALVYSMGMQNPDSQWAGYGILSSYMNTTPQDFCYASRIPASHATCSQITNSTLQARPGIKHLFHKCGAHGPGTRARTAPPAHTAAEGPLLLFHLHRRGDFHQE